MQLFLPVLFFFAVALGQSPLAHAETLTVKVSGLVSGTGNLQVMLWKDPVGFPTKPELALRQKSVAVAGTQMEVSFPGLAQGTYAVAAYQDLNGNGKLDRSVFGWPTEPTAASNAAHGRMGPPTYADAAFELKQASQSIGLKFK